MSVVVETQEVVPKPCNLFFIGQLWVGPPASALSSMFIPAGARSYHLLHQEHLSLPGCLQLPDHEHHLGEGPPITEASDHSDMQIPASCFCHRLYSLVPEEAKPFLIVHELGLRASCYVHLYEDDDGFQCSSQQEESTTTDCTNAHNQKFAAGFRALCPDSDRNKVNSRLPPLLEKHSGSVRDGEIILYTRRQATRVR